MVNSKKETSTLLKKEDVIQARNWFLFDASGKTLGRFAAEITKILRGKHKPTFTSHVDGGDGVIIINADKIKVTGSKEAQKSYRYYTGAIGGLREVSYRDMQRKKPDYIIRHAVKGMMPKTKLANAQLKRLRIYVGDQHNMEAQKPIPVSI